MKVPKFGDKILYTLCTHSGGQDGLDNNQKGGEADYSFNARAFDEKLKDSRYYVKKEVISDTEVAAILAKVDKKVLFFIEQVAKGILTAPGGNIR